MIVKCNSESCKHNQAGECSAALLKLSKAWTMYNDIGDECSTDADLTCASYSSKY